MSLLHFLLILYLAMAMLIYIILVIIGVAPHMQYTYGVHILYGLTYDESTVWDSSVIYPNLGSSFPRPPASYYHARIQMSCV